MKPRISKTIFFISFLLVISIAVGVVILKEDKSVDPRSSAEEQDNIEGIPNIITVPPQSIQIGEEYFYNVKVVDADSDLVELDLELIEGPDWLVKEGFILSGTPEEEELGQHKVVIRVSDEETYEEQAFYIVVE